MPPRVKPHPYQNNAGKDSDTHHTRIESSKTTDSIFKAVGKPRISAHEALIRVMEVRHSLFVTYPTSLQQPPERHQ